MTKDRGREAQRARLVASFILGGFNGNIYLANEDTPGFPPHEKLNYGFKSVCLADAYCSQADIAIWADTRMVLSQPFDKLLKAIKAGPSVFLHKNPGWTVGQWTNDECLEEFGVTREQAFEIPTVVSGFIAFDFTDQFTFQFFTEFHKLCHIPAVINGLRSTGRRVAVDNKEHLGHRHDQCILSLMAHKYKINLAEGYYADTTNACCMPKELILNKTEETLFEWLP